MRDASLYLSCLFLLFTDLSIAIEKSTAKEYLPINVTLAKDINGGFRLVSRDAQLTEILNKISEETGVSIHYSTVSKTPVTLSCSGATVKPLLECLFGSSAGFIVRYVENSSTQSKHQQIDQVWLLNTAVILNTFESERSHYGDDLLANEELPETGKENSPLDSTQIKELLTMAKAENPKQRVLAITKLVNHGSNDDAYIASAFKQALTDDDVSVRAVAIHGLAQMNGIDASASLQQALLDDNISVRLMALSSVDNNSNLLLQALTDSDETVRQMAEAKLAVGNKGEEGN